jgi:hypothetical protein
VPLKKQVVVSPRPCHLPCQDFARFGPAIVACRHLIIASLLAGKYRRERGSARKLPSSVASN